MIWMLLFVCVCVLLLLKSHLPLFLSAFISRRASFPLYPSIWLRSLSCSTLHRYVRRNERKHFTWKMNDQMKEIMVTKLANTFRTSFFDGFGFVLGFLARVLLFLSILRSVALLHDTQWVSAQLRGNGNRMKTKGRTWCHTLLNLREFGGRANRRERKKRYT